MMTYDYTLTQMHNKSVTIFDNVFIRLSFWHFSYYAITVWTQTQFDRLDGSATYAGNLDDKLFLTRRGALAYAKKKDIILSNVDA